MNQNFTFGGGPVRETEPKSELHTPPVVSHHDRNYSLPTTSAQESGPPQRVKLNRAATVSKSEHLKQPAHGTELQNLNEPLPTHQYLNAQTHNEEDLPIDSNMHPHPQVNSSVTQHPAMPMIDMAAATISIPDLQSENTIASPLATQPTGHYDDTITKSLPLPLATPAAPAEKPASEGKNPSEYALHILFTQVRKFGSFFFIAPNC